MGPRWRFQLITIFILALIALFTFTFYHREGESGIVHEIQGYIGQGVDYLSRPFVAAFDGVKSGFNFFKNLRSLKRENRELKKKIDYLRIKLNQLSEIEAENKRLRKLLDFQERSDLNLIPARVSGFSPREEESVMLIDKGSDDGLKKGQAVISPDGLVGKIIRVQPRFSLVQLIIDSKSQVGVRLVRSRELGVLTSTEDGLRIKLLSIQADVRVGDEVVTSGLGGVYPRELYVGKVSKVKEDPNSVEKKVWVESSVPFEKLEEVFVVVEK